MLFWPSVAAGGFLALAALVVALARSSTERYEFERNRVQAQRERAAVPVATGSPVGRPDGGSPASSGGAAQVAQDAGEQRTAVGVATHPAGKRLGQPGDAPAWWLVDERADQPGEQVVAGPFAERLEAEGVGLTDGPDGCGRAV